MVSSSSSWSDKENRSRKNSDCVAKMPLYTRKRVSSARNTMDPSEYHNSERLSDPSEGSSSDVRNLRFLFAGSAIEIVIWSADVSTCWSHMGETTFMTKGWSAQAYVIAWCSAQGWKCVVNDVQDQELMIRSCSGRSRISPGIRSWCFTCNFFSRAGSLTLI